MESRRPVEIYDGILFYLFLLDPRGFLFFFSHRALLFYLIKNLVGGFFIFFSLPTGDKTKQMP